MPVVFKGRFVGIFLMLCAFIVSCGVDEGASDKGVKRAQTKAIKKIKQIDRKMKSSKGKLLAPGKVGKKGKKAKRGKGPSCTICKPCNATSDCAVSEVCSGGKCMRPCDTKAQGPNDCPKRTVCKRVDQGGKTSEMCVPRNGCSDQFSCGGKKGGKKKGGKKKGGKKKGGKKGKKARD